MKIIFSEGKDFLTYSHHQEYSVLQNEYARLFVSVIQSHAIGWNGAFRLSEK